MADIESTNPMQQPPAPESLEKPAGDICTECKTPITNVYYRANQAMVCVSCFNRRQGEQPRDSHAAFVRAVLFGLVGFAIGLTVYAGFEIATGISIGYVALAVGWIVGKAMMLGSKGIGGRRYQITAILLTYAAVSMAVIPLAISMVIKKHNEPQQHALRQAPPSQTDTPPPARQNSADQSAENSPRERVSFGHVLGQMVLLGLASPFMELQDGFNGVIGLVILLVGMQFAWKMTAGPPKITLEGPYELNAPAPNVNWRTWS
jgi:hypothetical protein